MKCKKIEILKYRTTLNDFRNRIKVFRYEKNKILLSNASRLDDKLRVLLFINAKIDLEFYTKMIHYHSMTTDDLHNSDVIAFNWLKNDSQTPSSA